MYKDKPYGGDFRQSSKRKKTRSFIIGALFLGFLFVVYCVGKWNAPTNQHHKGPFSWLRTNEESRSWPERQDAVKTAFQTSWEGYKKYAWGKDVYQPVSQTGKNMGPKPLGWIIVDSLDTMHIMGLKDELKEAREWVKTELNYDMDYEVNTFETTIRMLGGLLSAHYLTRDDLYLDKAVDLGNRLLGAFKSQSGVPYASVNLGTSMGKPSHADMGASSTAEATTLQLEFKYLSKLTGETLYWEAAEKVMKIADANQVTAGLVPIFIRPDTGKFQGDLIRLGSRGDSYYEYLLKQYLQTNGEEPIYREIYDEAVAGIKEYMIAQSYPNKLTYIGELESGVGGELSPKMDHLVCFAGGMLALGATEGQLIDEARRNTWTTVRESDFRLAMEITRSCYETYKQTETGLGPEIVQFNTDPKNSEDFTIKTNDAHNLQRPETVESLFVLWRLTKNPIYREWGWKIFEAFEKWTKLQGDAGYVSIQNVRKTPSQYRDNMESFWLSETLKYLYLLFDDSENEILPLTDVVFNTEAHPFPKFSLDPLFRTGWTRIKRDISKG
jgi:hypothetical protein